MHFPYAFIEMPQTLILHGENCAIEHGTSVVICKCNIASKFVEQILVQVHQVAVCDLIDLDGLVCGLPVERQVLRRSEKMSKRADHSGFGENPCG